MKDATRSTQPLFWLLPAFALFLILTWQYRFVQDDAYISYRYVANFLSGHGLVFNIEEQVEGYTNHGWVILLSLFGAFGIDYILLSRILGVLSGMGVIYFTWKTTRQLLSEADRFLVVVPAYLVAAVPSLAYWASAGLETTAFALAVMASLYWYLVRSRLLVWGLALAVWLRPEGALVALLLVMVQWITERRRPLYALASGFIAFVLSLPMVGFKLSYYGAILPNPFYAKTGWDSEQFAAGLAYVAEFVGHYPLLACGLIASTLLYRRLSQAAKALGVFTLLYTLYIVAVGGDVLKVHRFFLPIIGAMAVLFGASLIQALNSRPALKRKSVPLTVVVGIVGVGAAIFLPRANVGSFNMREKLFVTRMSLMAENMAATDSTGFSVAVPTIGVFGYKLLGHDVIDMLGLTDSTIARHPEPPVPGIESTWKERSYNSAYLLQRQPDYILFSTGIKPSAPAELALTLYPQFQQAYRAVSWYFSLTGDTDDGSLKSAFKRVRPVDGELRPTYPAEFALEHKRGIEEYTNNNAVPALKHLNRALEVSPRPYYLYTVYYKAASHLRLNQMEEAMRYLEWVVQEDPYVFEAHRDLYLIYAVQQDHLKAEEHRGWVRQLMPWYLPRLDSAVARQVVSARQAAGQR